eukprot:7378022-Prymnesium_polylepis.1
MVVLTYRHRFDGRGRRAAHVRVRVGGVGKREAGSDLRLPKVAGIDGLDGGDWPRVERER